MSMTSNSSPPGWLELLFHRATTPPLRSGSNRISEQIGSARRSSDLVAEWQTVEHVHDFELEPAGLVGIAVPQGDHPALAVRVEQDQRADRKRTPLFRSSRGMANGRACP